MISPPQDLLYPRIRALVTPRLPVEQQTTAERNWTEEAINESSFNCEIFSLGGGGGGGERAVDRKAELQYSELSTIHASGTLRWDTKRV